MPDSQRTVVRDPAVLALGHGLFNLAGGTWPLVSMRSFEWFFGPKRDRWLQRTAAALLASAGWSQLRAGTSPDGLEHARRIGLCTATTLLTIDVVYFARGQIKWTYLLDGVAEACWIAAWLQADVPKDRSKKRK